MARRILLLTAVCSLIACDSPDSTHPCTLVLEPAIVVRIRDSVSKLPAAEGATGYVREGSYLDSLRTHNVELSKQAAFERPGTYTVVVIKTGYQTWKKDGVRVGSNECHVETVSLDAYLVKQTE